MIMSKNELEEKLKDIKDLPNSVVYRVSLSYFVKAMLLSFVLFSLLIISYNKVEYNFKGILIRFLQIILIFYLAFYKYKVLSHKIYVYNDKILHGNIEIKINEIKELKIDFFKINKNTSERVLYIIDKNNKKYIFRLNLFKKYYFIKRISMLSNIEVEIIS